jgi:glutathione S-transferase
MTDTTELILHHAPGTRSVRVLWLLREMGLPVQVVERPLLEWVMDREYRKVNPSGRLPFVLDRGTPRSESLALMQTLIETRQPDSALWRAPGHPERPELLQWMQYSETVQVHVQNLNQQLNFVRPPEARSAATVKLEVVRLGRALDVVEQALAARDHLLAGGFSAADIAMGYVVAVSQVFRPLQGQPRLQDYVGRLQARPAAAGLLDFPVAAVPVSI